MEEVWKEVEGLVNVEVSTFGNVRSWRCKGKPSKIRSESPKMLSQKDNGKGYKCINIRQNGENILSYVHILVAKAFIPNPDNLPQVNHKDENKANNNVENLEWCTHKYNMNYRTIRNRLSEAMKGKPSTFKGKHHSEKTKEIIRQKKLGTHTSEEARLKMSESRRGEKNQFFGKHHTEETKQKLRELAIGRAAGKKNPMYGKNAYEGKSAEEMLEINRKKSESLKRFYANKRMEEIAE